MRVRQTSGPFGTITNKYREMHVHCVMLGA